MDEINEFEILKEIGQGNDCNFSKIIEKHSKSLLNFIYRFILKKEEAEELCQEVFLRIYKNACKIKPEAKFSTILYKIASNLCIDYLRKIKKAKTISLTATGEKIQIDEEKQLIQIPDNKMPDPHLVLEETEKLQKIYTALNSLPESQRLALILKIYENKSYKEISEIMGISISSVESLIFRARQNIRKELKI